MESVNPMHKSHTLVTSTVATRSRSSPARRRPSNASAGRMSCACSEDSAMMKRPIRRPSFDGASSDLSLDDDDASECTHVTSNQHGVVEELETQDDNKPSMVHQKPAASVASTVTTAKITLADSLLMKPSSKTPTKQTRRTSLPGPPKAPVPRIDWQSLNGDHGDVSFVRDDPDDAPEDTTMTTDAATTTNTNNNTSLVLTKSKIRSFMKDYYEDFDSIFQTNPASATATRQTCMEAFVEHYFTHDFTFIRPSGNPLDGRGFATLMAQRIRVISMQLVSIDSVQVLAGGLAAIVLFTADQRFSFQGGPPQSDRTIITAVLNTTNGRGREGSIQIAHKHRSPGKPIPKTTRWEASA